MVDGYDPFALYDPATLAASDPIEIDAPASVVWQILIDLPRYGEWNPFCVWAESTLEMGAPVYMRLVTPVAPGTLAPNCEYVCAFEPERMLSWELVDSPEWPYPARRDQIITPLGPDRCRYVSTDTFTGPNGIHVMRFAGPWVTRAFNDSARALKARAEAFHAADTRAAA
ncbi:SRPBCC domain-containing protein [Sphingomonas sp. RP10(2022)]|uniref:SRPBCC domain-containing protein n=1 Tax=Sphingomonas liriopis TaxID=2949094 RepID=A0A9X2I129_9SPHN|nr:SRPBCC domain-containing protein [Sphingomonas liriopis]MCP3735900.1 SRPBCC domain-containing protein [Sphingomonas liriopis]